MHLVTIVLATILLISNSPLIASSADRPINPPKCGTWPVSNNNSKVITLTDGAEERCLSVIWPDLSASKQKKIPILFWFHGLGGNAMNCGENPLVQIARDGGFALVCAEARLVHLGGGSWDIPNVITDATGTPCGTNSSHEIPYMKNAMEALRRMPFLDTSRIFFSGCSQGSGFSNYISTCYKQDALTAPFLSAFATHSTGLKVKGDGIEWDCCSVIETCAECQYFPSKPFKAQGELGLKACIFDNFNDRLPRNDSAPAFFYESSTQLAAAWQKLGNRAETHFGAGEHCNPIDFAGIAKCLDDDTGRLLQRPLPCANKCDVPNSGCAGKCDELVKQYPCADYYAPGKQYAGWCDKTCGYSACSKPAGVELRASNEAKLKR